ncbi:Neurotrypsin [Geodia barretti]|uniref:Neurotrypsin n=1 Tax=Geodia barretti TaxID=519541 RepID=A0AA35XF91_GEOBA|nr:Neurotrypsin [Geodia barretti]
MKEFKCCKMTFNFTAFLTIWLLVGVKSYENIDECELGLDNCDENTNCTNTVGSYICTCYCGDGRNCTVSDTSMGIRLVDGNETSGLVEVLRNCEWRSICDDYWTDEDAMVACGKLGFLPYAAGSYRRGIFRDGEEVQYWLDDVQCTGNEVSLFDCPHKDTHNCGRRERAGVHCLDTDDVAIQLVENTTLYSGIIELRIRGEWRSVCHDKWTDKDAQVACRSMGLPFTCAKNEINGKFEPGEEVTYWLSQVNCQGDEESLLA